MYNVEPYLQRCVKSIANQTYGILEIILIDDGSTDRSGNICNQLAKEDYRIKVIHKKNGGLSSARNVGIEAATGDFITFVDSDDWINTSIYQKCISAIADYGCDVVDFKVTYVAGKKIPDKNPNKKNEAEVVEKKNIPYDYLYRGQTEKCPFSVCRKLYKKELYDGVRFPEGKVNEDIATNFKVLLKSSREVYLPFVGYYYFQGSDTSITSGKLKKKDFELLEASRELCKLSRHIDDPRVYQLARVKLGRSYFSLLAKAATGGTEEDVTKKDIDFLKYNLKKSYALLIGSPMPVNRKILISLICLNYAGVEKSCEVYKKIRHRR